MRAFYAAEALTGEARKQRHHRRRRNELTAQIVCRKAMLLSKKEWRVRATAVAASLEEIKQASLPKVSSRAEAMLHLSKCRAHARMKSLARAESPEIMPIPILPARRHSRREVSYHNRGENNNAIMAFIGYKIILDNVAGRIPTAAQ